MTNPVEYRIELPDFKGPFDETLHRVLDDVRACDYACTSWPIPLMRAPEYQKPSPCIVVAVVASADEYENVHMLARMLADTAGSPVAFVTETPVDAVAVVKAAPALYNVTYAA